MAPTDQKSHPQPSPSVKIIDFNAMDTVIGVRTFCHDSHYGQVCIDTDKAIVDVGGEAG